MQKMQKMHNMQNVHAWYGTYTKHFGRLHMTIARVGGACGWQARGHRFDSNHRT